MNAVDLATDLQRQGFTLTPLPEGKFSVKPAERLNDELRQRIRQHKAELLALLTHPYINHQGELVIPFTSDPKYHWWAGGQSVRQTLVELGAPPEVAMRYLETDLTKAQ